MSYQMYSVVSDVGVAVFIYRLKIRSLTFELHCVSSPFALNGGQSRLPN